MNSPKAGLSVLVTPHDGHHYQELLYSEVAAAGVRVRYTDGPTPSQTLNIFLGPAVLVWCRIRGSRILHIHWLFQFSLPWARQKRWAMRLMRWWYGMYLRIAISLGYAIVWTAHDLVPHERIFDDDGRATSHLISKAAAVIALSETTAEDLHSLGVRDVRVIPFGSYAIPYPESLTSDAARISFGFNKGDVVVLFIGRIEPYKGVDLLLRAAKLLPSASKIKILVAGTCPDKAYRRQLDRLILEAGARVTSVFEWIADDDIARYLQASDVAIFPFREVTNSASVRLAQSFGRPVIIPNLRNLRDVPQNTAIRFEPIVNQDVGPIIEALCQVENLSKTQYSDMSAAALTWATRFEWADAARATIATYRDVCRFSD